MKSPALALLLLLATGCASTSYLAKVNDDTLTGADMRREFALSHNALGKYMTTEPIVREYVDKMIDRRLLVQEAYRVGIQDLPEVQDAMARYERRFLAKTLLSRTVEVGLTPTEEQIKAAWETTDHVLRGRQVVVATREEADRLRAQVAAGADIEAIARASSIAPSANRGGEVVVSFGVEEGWEEVVLPLQAGALSPVFRSNRGWEFVKVEERAEVQRQPIEQARHQIQATLKGRARAKRQKAFLEEVRAKHEAKVLDCDLSRNSLTQPGPDAATTMCLSWKEGQMSLKTLASRLDVKRLAAEPGDGYARAVDAAVRDVLNQEVLYAEAVARGIAAEPDIVAEIAVQRERLMQSILEDRYVFAGIDVTEADVTAYVAEHPDIARIPEVRTVRQFAVRGSADARIARERLDAGESFDEVTKAVAVVPGSAVTIRSKDVDLSPDLVPFFALPVGGTAGPIETKTGYIFGKVTAVEPPRTLDAKATREAARAILTKAKGDAAYAKWISKLKESATIEVNEAGIRAYVRDNPIPAALTGAEAKDAPPAATTAPATTAK